MERHLAAVAGVGQLSNALRRLRAPPAAQHRLMLQARNYTRTSGRQVDVIVIHSAETPERDDAAENVAAWFAGPDAPEASSHWVHDNNSSVRCVEDQHVAWHAPGCNHNGIGHEQAGYASQSRSGWLDDYSRAQLTRMAAQVRTDCDRHDIPIRRVDAAGLRRGERGITTHWEVTKAFRRSTHTDPGSGFPMDHFLDLVRGSDGGAPAPDSGVATGDQLLRRGDEGQEVEDWQRILVGAGHDIAIDGDFGPRTEEATEAFQADLGVSVDGVVGPETRGATARLLAWLAAQRPTPEVPPFPGTARRGDTGAPARAYQTRLRDRGWRIVVDGVYGPQTEAVVTAFQEEKGIGVDGVAGPETWRTLWTAPIT